MSESRAKTRMRFKNVTQSDLAESAGRFWSKVRKGEESECWEWIGGLKNNGYGSYFVSMKHGHMSAHRSSWILNKGEIAHGFYVCHACDNRKCVNPSHLWIGTAKDNQQDMAKKGRVYSCQKKLSEEDKKRIYELRAGGMDRKEIAALFGILPPHVSRVFLRMREKNDSPLSRHADHAAVCA